MLHRAHVTRQNECSKKEDYTNPGLVQDLSRWQAAAVSAGRAGLAGSTTTAREQTKLRISAACE
jgi:hypothetical protein